MFSLPISLGLVLSEDKLSMRVVYWVGFAVNVWCWITAFTRGAWIGGAGRHPARHLHRVPAPRAVLQGRLGSGRASSRRLALGHHRRRA